MTDEKHVFDLLPAYSLGALDDADAFNVKKHLAVCPTCRDELEVYQATVDQLPFGAHDVTPRPEVKKELLEKIEARKSAMQHQQSTKSWLDRLSDLFRQTSPAWGTVALLLVVTLFISNLSLRQKVDELEVASQEEEIQWVMLSGSENTEEAQGTLLIAPDGLHATLIVEGLPSLAENQQYQLWLIEGEERTSAGVFSIGGQGRASLEINAPEYLSNYSGFGVTIEPYGGSINPTGENVLHAEL